MFNTSQSEKYFSVLTFVLVFCIKQNKTVILFILFYNFSNFNIVIDITLVIPYQYTVFAFNFILANVAYFRDKRYFITITITL